MCYRTSFQAIVNFSDAEFHDIVYFNQSRIRFLKRINAEVESINFEGAIIDEANFWNIHRLENYSFKNSYLLSISFAERELINCDFTGAVMDAVRTRGWNPDDNTLKNTKFIYNDYAKRPVIKEDTGKEKYEYHVLEESRVPASGFFGEGEHENFTIADYLKERYRWSRAINPPVQIRTAVLNYIQFFSDFIRITEGYEVEIHTKKEGEKIRVEFITETKEEKEAIEGNFYEYMNNALKPETEGLNITFKEREDLTQFDKDWLILQYERKISDLQHDLKLTNKVLEYEQKLTDSEKEKVRILQKIIDSGKGLQEMIEAPQTSSVAGFCVLQGDIAKSSRYKKEMASFSKGLEKILDFEAGDCRYKNAGEGDSITIIHNDPEHLCKVALNISRQVPDKLQGRPQIRLAIEYGQLKYEQTANTFYPMQSGPLITSARIEPLVTPGQ